MNLIVKVADAIDGLNDFVGRAMAWLTVVMVLNVFVVVVLRYVFSVGWIWMQELYVWTNGAVFMLGAAYTLLHEGHVRIDLIYRSASVRYKAWVDLFGSIFLGLPLMGLILAKSWRMVERSWGMSESSSEAGGLPGLYLFKSVIVLFAILFGLQLVSLMFRSLDVLVRGARS